jgi:hypothetical protein
LQKLNSRRRQRYSFFTCDEHQDAYKHKKLLALGVIQQCGATDAAMNMHGAKFAQHLWTVVLQPHASTNHTTQCHVAELLILCLLLLLLLLRRPDMNFARLRRSATRIMLADFDTNVRRGPLRTHAAAAAEASRLLHAIPAGLPSMRPLFVGSYS